MKPPALVVEWMMSSTGQLFHRRIEFRNLLPCTDAVLLARDVQHANQDLLADRKVPFSQLVSLVRRFSETANGALDSEEPASRVSPGVSRASLIRERAGDVFSAYDVDQKSKLGRGSFGTVSRAKDRATGRVCAVKTMARPEKGDVDRTRVEVALTKEVDHPNIVKLYETFEDHRNLYLVLEICEGGELFDKIVETGHLTECDAARSLQQLFCAVHYLHRSGICHRDLKPQNLLLKARDAELASATLKVIDFGMACRIAEGSLMSSRVGTPYYLAPEVLAGRYDERCDQWSCGVLMFFLLCGHRPFVGKTKEELFGKIQKAEVSLAAPEWCCVSSDAKELVLALLRRDPRERLTAEGSLSHVWVKSLAPGAQKAPLQKSIVENLCSFQAMNKLKKSVMHVIAGDMDDHQISDLRATFSALDTNQDGILTLAELREGFARAEMPLRAPDLQRLMEAIDANHNDVIDYGEFLASALDAKKYLQEDICWSAFRVFDRDGNGRISASELAAVLQSKDVEAAVGKSAVEDVMSQVDLDGDGQIDFKEFMAMMRARS